MTEYSISTDLPATVHVKISVKAKTKKEAEVLARKYIRRTFDDNYYEKDWDGIIVHEEMPSAEIENVDCRKMDFQTINWATVPITFTGPDGELKQLPEKEFWAMRQKQWAIDDAKEKLKNEHV